MRTLFKKENLKNTLLTFIYLIAGVMFCVLPTKMFNFVETALCFVLLVVGIVCIIIHSLLATEDKPLKLLIFGIVGVGLGLCMMLVPRTFGVLLSIIIGYSGVSMIISGLKIKKTAQKTWITDFVIGIVVTSLSVTTIVLSLIGSSVGKNILAIFFGVILLINGIYLLVQMISIILKEKENKKKSLIENATANDEVVEEKQEQAEQIEEPKQEENTEELQESQDDEAEKKLNAAKRKFIKKK